MSRQPFSFTEEPDRARPHHRHVWLSGCLDGSAAATAELEKLADSLCRGITTVAIICAEYLSVVSGGAEQWAAFVELLPASIQLVYQSSQLSMIMQDFDDDFVRRHMTHVHFDPYTT